MPAMLPDYAVDMKPAMASLFGCHKEEISPFGRDDKKGC
jgi:hypothetical protein